MRDDVMIRFGTEAEKQTLFTEYPEIKNVIWDGGYFIVTGGDENEKDDRRIMGRLDQPAGYPDFRQSELP